MKKTILIPILASAVASVSLQADWTVVSTFDDASALDLITDNINIEGSNARSEIANGKWVVYPGDLFEATSNLYAMLDLGVDLKAASIAAGGPVTLYCEVIQPTVDDGAGGTRKAILDTVWGISNVDNSQVLETRYNSYNVMQRIVAGPDQFEGRNGTTYWAPTGGQQFQADVTYKIWIVVDYNLNYYTSYIQGGQWTDQTMLDTEDMSNIWLFRVNPAPENVVQYFQVSLSRGNSVAGEKQIDPAYFDNVAIDTTGENLTAPPVDSGFGMWGPWEIIDAAGNVDTGSWMGFVNVGFGDYVWSYSLNQWLFIDEAGLTSSGSWVYVFNF